MCYLLERLSGAEDSIPLYLFEFKKFKEISLTPFHKLKKSGRWGVNESRADVVISK